MTVTIGKAPQTVTSENSSVHGAVRRSGGARFDPIASETRQLLDERWHQLPEYLRRPNQVVGRHWVQCGYTLGPSYCSFGCSHCYLPAGANRVPLVTVADMRQQIDANRRLLGPGGPLQITGGDVVDAYWRAGRSDDLVEILAYANRRDLVPMLMTHGEVLREQPDYLDRLVVEGGLRKLSIHIDMTQAGRHGYPVRGLTREADLNPLRDEFVDLVMASRRRTGHPLRAAQTVTVTPRNIASLGDVLTWMIERPANMDVCRTLSFQTGAATGRSLREAVKVTPAEVWAAICRAYDLDLPRDHLLFGHPDCSSTATFLARPRDGKVIPLSGGEAPVRRFWAAVLDRFGGIGGQGTRRAAGWAKKVQVVARHPGILADAAVFVRHLMIREGLTAGFAFDGLRGRARGFNVVMHNFMDDDQLQGPPDPLVADRLAACSFRGAVKTGDGWEAVPMCRMNASVRPDLYRSRQGSGVSP